MTILRVSKLTGRTHLRFIDVTPEQMAAWENGAHIQNAMPHLSPDEREFIMSGVTPEEWEEAFGKEES